MSGASAGDFPVFDRWQAGERRAPPRATVRNEEPRQGPLGRRFPGKASRLQQCPPAQRNRQHAPEIAHERLISAFRRLRQPPRKFRCEAILPDIAPSLTNSSLFAPEKAVRSSVVLGLVGAGGIGQELKVAFDLFQYRNASPIILVIFVIVLAMELITDNLRARIQ
ncbi:PhnE/PtxC family ABC transporter permease [Stappia indica]|uniref:PhnE/PtxC family ABC transporter permease n=1 Tax=Stappia indica TaxID=538381 RepID=UPI001CD3FF8C|nr:hypothetical protein [Stappia indica]MCA1298607.1 hypothetical protein [Stappia indica]